MFCPTVVTLLALPHPFLPFRSSPQSAEVAISKMNGFSLLGKPIKANWAIKKGKSQTVEEIANQSSPHNSTVYIGNLSRTVSGLCVWRDVGCVGVWVWGLWVWVCGCMWVWMCVDACGCGCVGACVWGLWVCGRMWVWVWVGAGVCTCVRMHALCVC